MVREADAVSKDRPVPDNGKIAVVVTAIALPAIMALVVLAAFRTDLVPVVTAAVVAIGTITAGALGVMVWTVRRGERSA